MFKCHYQCTKETSHFCENSEILLCSEHISKHLNDGCKENFLGFNSPVIEKYSEYISNRLQSNYNQINKHVKTVINSLSNLHKQINIIEKEALRPLLILRKDFLSKIKKLNKRTLTMNEAKKISETDLEVHSEHLVKYSENIKKYFLKMLTIANTKLLIIKKNIEPQVKNNENKGETKIIALARKKLDKKSSSDKKINFLKSNYKNAETKFINDNPTSTIILNNENQIKKVESEEIFKFWECECKASNCDNWEACIKCGKIKPGLRGWICTHCSFRNKSQNIVQCEKCLNYKNLKNCKSDDRQELQKHEFFDKKKISVKNQYGQLNSPCKNNEKTIISSGRLDNSPEIIKTEKTNEEMYLNSYGIGISIDKTFFNPFQDSSYIVVRDKEENYAVKNFEKVESPLIIKPDSPENFKEHIPKEEQPRLRSNSPNESLNKERKDIKISCMKEPLISICNSCSYAEGKGIPICSNCNKDRKECIGQSSMLEKNIVANIEEMKSSICLNESRIPTKINFNENIKLSGNINQHQKDIVINSSSMNRNMNKQAMRSKSLPKKH